MKLVRWIFMNVFGRLAGYRKYRFKLSNGNKFVCWSKTEAMAQRAYHKREDKILVNREKIIQTIQDGAEIGRRARDVPDELVKDVLSA